MKKKPPTSIIPGNESRRRREIVSEQRDAEIAPHEALLVTISDRASTVAGDVQRVPGLGVAPADAALALLGLFFLRVVGHGVSRDAHGFEVDSVRPVLSSCGQSLAFQLLV